jgi:hypothetical protein
MVAELRSSCLTLFPRTFRVAHDPLRPYDPDADLDAIDNHLKSSVLSL